MTKSYIEVLEHVLKLASQKKVAEEFKKWKENPIGEFDPEEASKVDEMWVKENCPELWNILERAKKEPDTHCFHETPSYLKEQSNMLLFLSIITTITASTAIYYITKVRPYLLIAILSTLYLLSRTLISLYHRHQNKKRMKILKTIFG